MKKQKKKVYGGDIRFASIYERIKMRVPISVSDRVYYLKEIEKYEKTNK